MPPMPDDVEQAMTAHDTGYPQPEVEGLEANALADLYECPTCGDLASFQPDEPCEECT